jgi:hypothetical protein
MIKLSRAVKHRQGDGASSRAGREVYTLSDKTQFGINIEIVFYPKDTKKVCWFILLWSQDKDGKHASVAEYGKNLNNKTLKRIYLSSLFQKNVLCWHPYKVRRRMMESWVKKIVDFRGQ